MFVYWLMFAVPLLGALSPVKLSKTLRVIPWLGLSVGTVFLIGFRSKIGGDWNNYLELYLLINETGIGSVLNSRSVGYGFVNWVSGLLGWGLYGVNTFCGVIFTAGLAYFCSKQPLPWLAWLVATPYMIIVVAMGYTTQSVALGAVMFGYIFMSERRIFLFVIAVVFGYLFHKSAALVLLLLLTLVNKTVITLWMSRLGKPSITSPEWLTLIIGIIVFAIFSATQLGGFLELIEYYVFREQWKSQGGVFRVLMNAVAGTALLLSSRFWRKYSGEPGFWKWLSILSIVSLPLVFWSSTVIDRMSLYLIPLQIYVWSRTPLLFKDSVLQSSSVLMLCGVYAIVLWVWLNYASHSYEWIPYASYPLF